MTYRSFPAEIMANLWGYGYFGSKARCCQDAPHGAPWDGTAIPAGGRRTQGHDGDAAVADRSGTVPRAAASQGDAAANGGDEQGGRARPARRPAAASGPDLGQVSARKNLNETAFFFPHLAVRRRGPGEDRVHHARGAHRVEVPRPSPTTATCGGGLLEDKAVTAKDLMVQPNPPRFLREGDVLEFTVKVTNQSATRQTGTVRLTLADARTGKLGRSLLRQPRHRPELRHSRQGVAELLLAAAGARRGGRALPTRRSARRAGSPTARRAACRSSRGGCW